MTLAGSFRHRLYGLDIESTFALPGAPARGDGGGPPDLTVAWSPATGDNAPRATLVATSERGSSPGFGIEPDGGHVLVWEGEVMIRISPDVRTLDIVSRPRNRPFAPELLTGIALGVVLHLRGGLCLHGAALRYAGRTLAVLGDSGSGKSSLAAAMIRRGATLYTDDLVAITKDDRGGHRVVPGSTGLRVCNDAARELLDTVEHLPRTPFANKLLWDLSAQSPPASPSALDALYWLEPVERREAARVSEAIPVREALPLLVRAWYPPGLGRLLTRARLDQIRDLAETVPVYVLRYERRWDGVPRLLELLAP